MKSFIELLKKVSRKYTVFFAVFSLLSIVSIFFTWPECLTMKHQGVISSIIKAQEPGYGGRFKTKYYDVYIIKLKEGDVFLSASIKKIDEYGVDSLIDKKIVYTYHERYDGNKIMESLIVANKTVFAFGDYLLLFIASIIIAPLCTIGAVYGLIDEYWYGNE